METHVTQRWRKRKARYRPAGETINPRHYEVAVLDDEKLAKEFVAENHYLETLPPVRRRFGLYRRTRLVGVAIFTVPTSYKAITKFFGSTDHKAYMDLGRFVLLHEVESNGESWFLARCLHLLRKQGVPGVMTFADPEPRRGAQGSIVFPGHIGTCYQALNATFYGRATARTLRLFPDGSSFNDRTASKLRKGEKGLRYACKFLEQRGAEPVPEDRETRARWFKFWRERLTRGYRHRGNLRYVFALDPQLRKHIPPGLPYPRFRFSGIEISGGDDASLINGSRDKG